MKKFFTLLFLIISFNSQSQLYFPPLTGNTWDTLSPATLGWCPSNIDSLYSYLQQINTDAFIVLKNGKIVLEKYFGTFTADSVHYWASAGKSLIGVLTGIAQEKGLINIDNPVSNYLGNGWSVAPQAKESKISIRSLLTMTSGFNDNPTGNCDNESIAPACLQYLVDTGQRWAYHTGAYQQISGVISAASGQSINAFTNANLGTHIGTTGLWVNGVFYSKPRTMARFGLLALNKGIWNTDTLIRNAAYWNAMVNTSQPYNQSYGYLWWLNGKNSYLAPGLPYVFSGPLFPDAPADMYCALGKNDQKIYVVPSQQLVVIRTGESAYGVAVAFSPFDNLLWSKIQNLDRQCSYTFTGNGSWNTPSNWTNNTLPPTTLDKQGIITIKPVAGGECILNTPQIIAPGSTLMVPQNAKLRVTGNLAIQH